MIRSFLKMYGLDPGMNANDMLVMRFTLPDLRYKTARNAGRFAERLSARSGVDSPESGIGPLLKSNIPSSAGAASWQFEQEGQAPMEKDKLPRLSGLVVTPEYFQTVGVRVSRGRSFEISDGAPGKPNAIVNQSFAAKYWSGARSAGQAAPPGPRRGATLAHGRRRDPGYHAERSQPYASQYTLYIPYRHDPQRGASIIAGTRVRPGSLIAAFRTEVRTWMQTSRYSTPGRWRRELMDRRWPLRVFGTLFAVFATIGLVLSAVGIYAVVAYSVSRRTQEIGIRMALGASRGSVLRLVLSLGLKHLAIGLVIGLGISFGLTRVLKAILVQISPTDPVTFAAISALLLAVGGYACWTPARKATKIDPMIALRHE